MFCKFERLICRRFKIPDEANIVDKLRDNCSNILSSVAEGGKRLVGHVLFSPAAVKTQERKVKGMELAPTAGARLEASRKRTRNLTWAVLLNREEFNEGM